MTTLDYELRGMARYKWPALALSWVICVVGWAVVVLMPNQYEASARLFVDTRTALTPVIQDLAVQDDTNAYLNLARESIASEARIEGILRETGLVLKATTEQQKARLIDKIRSNIDVKIAQTGDRAQQSSGVIYTITYRDSIRSRALQVTDILLNTFIETTLGGKRESSATAQEFLTKQIAENEQKLRDAEQRLAEFKKRNVGLMPGVEGDYFTRLQTEIDSLSKARNSLSVELFRREELSKQRRGETPFSVAGQAGAARPGTGSDTQAQLAEAQQRLAALSLRFTERHPDVIAAKEEIASLEKRREREIEALRRGDPAAAMSAGAAANPVFQQIQLQLNEVDVRVAQLRGEIAQHEGRIRELQKLVNSVPEVEAEFKRLNRDYEVDRAQYQALVERLEKARLGQDASETSAVRFEIIDPPQAGFRPVAPNRPVLASVMLVAGIALAAGLAFLLHRLYPVFNRAAEVVAATGLEVLGEVSLSVNDGSDRTYRRGLLHVAGSCAGLFAIFAVVMWFSLTHRYA